MKNSIFGLMIIAITAFFSFEQVFIAEKWAKFQAMRKRLLAAPSHAKIKTTLMVAYLFFLLIFVPANILLRILSILKYCNLKIRIA